MFDNKIDWVTHLETRLIRREAREPEQDSKGVYIQGRAQAMGECKLLTQAKCSIIKSVFRRCEAICVSKALSHSEAEN